MSVTVRQYTKGWQVDVMTRLTDGSSYRERRRMRISKSAALRWGQDRERHVLQHGRAQPTELKKEVPTLKQFMPRFMDGYPKANRQKPSSIAATQTIMNVHLVPLLGAKRLDAITSEDVQRLKQALQTRAPKTVNNVLTVLNTLLKKAVEWDVIDRTPCSTRMLRSAKPSVGFHGFGDYERLVAEAKAADWRTYLIVLLGGEAGLRCGEMMALEWRDVDFTRGKITVERADWKGQVTAPKSGRLRHVGMTQRLIAALREHPHQRGPRVLHQDDGSPMTQKTVQTSVQRAARKANVKGGVHILRHTFCSHLAMRGAPGRAIQELAGHQDLGTTQRYMHLSVAAADAAIRLLDPPSLGVAI